MPRQLSGIPTNWQGFLLSGRKIVSKPPQKRRIPYKNRPPHAPPPQSHTPATLTIPDPHPYSLYTTIPNTKIRKPPDCPAPAQRFTCPIATRSTVNHLSPTPTHGTQRREPFIQPRKGMVQPIGDIQRRPATMPQLAMEWNPAPPTATTSTPARKPKPPTTPSPGSTPPAPPAPGAPSTPSSCRGEACLLVR